MQILDTSLILPVPEEVCMILEVAGYQLQHQEILLLEYMKGEIRIKIFDIGPVRHAIEIMEGDIYKAYFNIEGMEWPDIVGHLHQFQVIINTQLPQLLNYIKSYSINQEKVYVTESNQKES